MRRNSMLASVLLAAALVSPLSGCLRAGGDEAPPHTLVIRNDLGSPATVDVTVMRGDASLLDFEAPLDPGASASRELGAEMGVYEIHADTEGASLSGTVELQRPGQLVVVALGPQGLAISTPL
jgi:hypothetical protein